MQTLIKIVLAAFVFWIILSYLIPLLPAPISTVALVIVVLAAIWYALKLGGINLP